MQKRGQFTVFVILGIVLIVAFAFLILAKGLLVQNQLQSQADSVITQFLKTSSVSTYASSCTEEIAKQGIQLLALQGGSIYDYQGGPVNTSSEIFYEGTDFLYINYSTNSTEQVNRVRYGIIENTVCSEVRQNPPWYPKEYVYLRDLPSLYYNSACRFTDLTSGFFGTNTMTKLCDYQGTNRLGASQQASFVKTCELGTYSTPQQDESVQEQLAYYISYHLPECLNFSLYTERYNTNISVNSTPITNVTYGIEGTTIEVTYPFTVLVDEKPVTTFSTFTTQLDINLKQLYNFVFFLLSSDSLNVYYQIPVSYPVSRFYRPSYEVELEKNICPTCEENNAFDDLLRVTDSSTIINGEPLVMQTLIKNRRPALDWLHDASIASTDIDIMVFENQTITLRPEGYDPDDDTVVYNYSGWKEQYNTVFDFECCEQPGVNCADFLNPVCLVILDEEPHNWTQSDWFQNDGRTARYTTNKSDIGLHKVNITIREESGLYDYQEVKILVFDLPVAQINGSNNYSDIDYKHASLEDTYILNGTLSQASRLGGGSDEALANFSWNDTREPFALQTETPVLFIPQEEPDISTMRQLNYTKLGTHDTFLTVIEPIDLGNGQNFDLYSIPASLAVEVYACLPHRDEDFSYPYNTGDPFQANHTCCYNGTDGGIYGRFKEIDDACFGAVTYGNFYAFTEPDVSLQYNLAHLEVGEETDYTYIFSTFEAPTIIDLVARISPQMQNDIFKRAFTRYCSGARGNICGGPAEDVFSVEIVCSDDELLIPRGERCEGPPSSITENADSLTCVQYGPGVTFESAHLGSNSDGTCNPALECTDGFGDNKYDTGRGPYACPASCDGNGNCDYTEREKCYCESSCFPSGADPLCDGLPVGAVTGRTLNSCNNVGETYFQDRCGSACTVQETTTVCRASGSLGVGDGCTADPICDGISPGSCSATDNYRCDSECGPVFDDTGC